MIRNKSNLKTSDDRSISQRYKDQDLKCAKIFFIEANTPQDKKMWEQRIKELNTRIG